MVPHVILHNVMSVDGRIDWITPDIGQFYEIASRWKEDATLAGCDTLLEAYPAEKITAEDDAAAEPPKGDPGDTRSLLVVPDSRGRLRTWHLLRREPYWRNVIALCSLATPKTYLDDLRRQQVDSIVLGEERVDLRAALEELNARYGVEVVRVDSGGTLNGVLLRAGLVDEVSVLVHPGLVGGMTPRSIYRAPDLTSPDGVVPLRLVDVEKREDDAVWLRYEVVKPRPKTS
jgi:2,5-diamino-6-(ribosylamino)-4(3H)-pyrimidinone 5'-phosphate reductase